MVHGHAVVEAEGAGEGLTDLSVDGDLVHVAERGKAENSDNVFGLEFEVGGISVVGGEGQGKYFDGEVGTRALNIDIVGTGGMGGAASVFNGLAKGHLVVETKGAGEGIADFTIHGDGPFLQIAVLGEHGDDIASLQLKVGVSVFAGEGDGQELDGFVGTGAFDDDIILTGSIFQLCFLDEGKETAVLFEIKIAAVVDITADGDEVLHGTVGSFDADDIATFDDHLGLTGHNVVKVVFQIFQFVVLSAFNLDEVGIDVVGEATGVSDEVFEAFAFNHLITHGTTDGAFDAHNVVGHRDEEHVAILEVEEHILAVAHHVLVEVEAVSLATTGTLDVTDGTDGCGAAGCCKGVEGGVEGAEGETSLDAWDEYVQNWLSAGGQTLTDEANAWYQERN